MDANDGFMFLVLLLLSLGLFGSLSLTYCVWNKQTEVASELQNELHELQKRSEIADIQNEVHMLQREVQGLKLTNSKLQSELAGVHNTNSQVHLRTSEPSQDKGQLKRNVRHTSNDTDTLSATEILTNALSEIIEMKQILLSFVDCNKNEYNHTKCTLNPGLKGEPGNNGTPGMQGIAGQRGPPGLLVHLAQPDHMVLLGCKEWLAKGDQLDRKVTPDLWDKRGLKDLLVKKEQRENQGTWA